MNIAGIGSTTSFPVQKTAPGGEEATESNATKLAEKPNGGLTPGATDAATKAFNAALGKGAKIDATA